MAFFLVGARTHTFPIRSETTIDANRRETGLRFVPAHPNLAGTSHDVLVLRQT